MALEAAFGFSYTNGNAPLSGSVAVSGGQEIRLSESIPGASTDLEVACAFALAKLQGIAIKCDRDIQIDTNAADATGGQTIQIKAGIPFVWVKDSGITNPITENVAKIFLTLAAGAAAAFELRAIVDPT